MITENDCTEARDIEWLLRGTPWWIIPFSELRQIYFSALYLTQDALHYYLPAFLLAGVHARGWHVRFELAAHFEDALQDRDKAEFLNGLSPEQMDAIRALADFVNERARAKMYLYDQFPEFPN